MIERLRQYVFSIIVAALVCSLVKAFTGKKSGYSSAVSLVCGLVLILVLLSPWLHWDRVDLSSYTVGIKEDAERIIDDAASAKETELRSIIKERAEAYIMDKAESMDLSITADVSLDSHTPVPAFVVITGDTAPYAKNVLSRYIDDTFGISEDAQIWN